MTQMSHFMLNNNLQMREVSNGCIKMDAQPCRLGAMREIQYRFANTHHYDGESPKTHGSALSGGLRL